MPFAHRFWIFSAAVLEKKSSAYTEMRTDGNKVDKNQSKKLIGSADEKGKI